MSILLSLLLLFTMVSQAESMEGTQPTAAVPVVKADVLYWEGEELIVKEISGHEQRLRVTAETKIEGAVGGRFKTGDKIVAQVTSDGRALSITLQIPDSGVGVIPPGSR